MIQNCIFFCFVEILRQALRFLFVYCHFRQKFYHTDALTTRLRGMKWFIHISALMVMFVSVWTCGDLGTQKDFITMNMKSKSKMTAVTSSTGFHNNLGAREMLVGQMISRRELFYFRGKPEKSLFIRRERKEKPGTLNLNLT